MVRHGEGQASQVKEKLHATCPAQMSESADARIIVLEDVRTMSDVFDKYFVNKTRTWNNMTASGSALDHVDQALQGDKCALFAVHFPWQIQ